MNEYPIDGDRLLGRVTQVYGIDPVVDIESGEHVRDRDGIPKWKIRMIYEGVGPSGQRRKPEFIEVGVACHEHELDRSQGDWPTFADLNVRQWSMTDTYGTRHGMSLSAKAVRFGPHPNAAGQPAA